MKRKLNLKSAIGNTLKTIPLTVALTLFASGSAFAAEQGRVAIKDQSGKIMIVDTRLMSNDKYRKTVMAYLKGAWNNAEPIYFSKDGMHYDDFSKNAGPGESLEKVLSDAKQNLDTLDTTTPDAFPILGLADSIY